MASLPPLPIDALAVQNVIDTLAAVNPANGYGCELTPSTFDVEGTTPNEGVTYVFQMEEVPLKNSPAGFDDFFVPVVIVMHAQPTRANPEGSTTIEDRLRIMAADARKALGADLTRGGNALNTIFDENTEYALADNPPTATLIGRLMVRTRKNNRYVR